ncbi:MAG: translation initiation factor IF-2 [Bacilli bacterium]|nr:translation initiation factor IF-2 [Bacilli bacterium]
MSLLEYANDVELSVEEIKKLCERLSIEYGDENYLLSDTEITLLDNLVEECKTEEKEPIEQEEIEDTLEEETYDKAESLAENSRFDLDNNISFEKVKSKQKRTSDSKKAFQAERKKMYKNKEKLKSNEQKVSDDIVLYKEGMTVLEIAEALNDNVTNIIKKLIGLGIMANQNQSIDFETTEVLVSDYKKTLKKEETVDISNFENYEIEDKEEDLQARPPIVTIMGHVDHGKTTLLDYIRKSKVASKEAGGITQAIGAYSVNYNEKNITFIDTPGHEAFTAMRARGASITDIVIIIVAADDGVMPQTKEAIDHAKAAGVPIIVAINKIDKPEANIDKVMSELTEAGLTPEEWGGDIVANKISAATGQGIDELLDSILLVAEMNEYKANKNRYATGAVIESRQDKQVGSIVSLIIQNGTLRLGDPIVVGNSFGKVRTLKNDRGENIVEAPPSTPVEVTGFSNLPSAGDKFMAFESEKEAKNIAAERTLRQKNKEINKASMSLEDLFGQIKEGMKEINIVLKADVNGSCEAVKSSLEKINVEGVKLSVIRAGVGAITESDIVLAKASNALVIGFNVRANTKTMDTAKENGIEIKTYNIIYKVVEDIENAMKGMLEPIYDEKVTGKLEIRQIFKFSKVGLIAGCHVLDGTIKNNSKARIIRDDIVIYDGKIKSLQHEKDQVKEVKKDMDCGITLESCNDYKENDIIEVYELVEVKR